MNEFSCSSLEECYRMLSLNAKDYYLPSQITQVEEEQPTPLEFLRKWVSPNVPVIFKQAAKHWPAMTKWTCNYLRNKIGEKVVTVAVTPNGYADAVDEGYFVMPEERQMRFNSFLDIIEKKTKANGVFYIQKQNSNFLNDYPELHADCELHISWASEALGKLPDAVNFWMGEKEAITSLHKDHYENLYCVIKGEKIFTLYPPTDLPWIPYELFPTATYKENENNIFEKITDNENEIPWIPVDPLKTDLNKYPYFSNTTPVKLNVKEGDIMYLPSLWYHHVQQSQGCIAVNFWYDMEFDCKFVYNKFVESTVHLSKKTS